MRVMCINEIWVPSDESAALGPNPLYGDIDVIIKTVKCYGIMFYALERFGLEWGFSVECFIPISDIDECEIFATRELSPEKEAEMTEALDRSWRAIEKHLNPQP